MGEAAAMTFMDDTSGNETRYVIATLGGNKEAPGDWVEAGNTEDESEAIRLADELYGSGTFEKVSVRKTFFDMEKKQPVTIDFRVFGETRLQLSVPALVVLSMFGGIASFLITYFVVNAVT